MMTVIRILIISLLALAASGCATTYVPVSWGFGEQVQQLSHSDPTLLTLYERYDPERATLRVSGDSFDEVMMPSEVKYHLGAYRPDTKLIYRNLYHDYNDYEMRDLLVHEFGHHLWFNFMSPKQRSQWRAYLAAHPSPIQAMVRGTYPRPNDWDTEDFAFTLQYARRSDIEQLAGLQLISAQERDRIVQNLPNVRHGIEPPGTLSADATQAHPAPQLAQTGKDPQK